MNFVWRHIALSLFVLAVVMLLGFAAGGATGLFAAMAAWLGAALKVNNPGVSVRDAGIVDVNHGTCTNDCVLTDCHSRENYSSCSNVSILLYGYRTDVCRKFSFKCIFHTRVMCSYFYTRT